MKPVLMLSKAGLWVAVMLLAGSLDARADVTCAAARDSLYRQAPVSEYGNVVKEKMASSAFPVQIKQQGRALCVRSNYNQVLPVYNQNGTFYAMFRLTKGINWINGLPRGIYYINNRKIIVS